ncbi:MAG: ribosome hibernation-promoting factor, HPF/YfiA family [Geminicoccaceae bacterium]
MTLQVTGKNLDVGEALRSYVTERIGQTLDKYFSGNRTGHVRIQKERNRFVTDCSIQLRSGLSLQSHGESPDAYASADMALDRLEKRLRRYKRRLKKHHGSTADADASTRAQYFVIQADQDEAIEEADDNPIIIAETHTEIRELSVSDAVMQMDLSNRPFLVFRNASHGQTNIVYRRPDGNIGWIDPGTEPGETE